MFESAVAEPAAEPGREGERGRFLGDVLAGLGHSPRRLPSVWLYDAWGGRLFQRIAELPEYYLTRCEREILEREADRIVAPFAGRACTVVDLGAGDGTKTRLLLAALKGRASRLAYAPVDASTDALREVTARMAHDAPEVDVLPIAASYGDALIALGTRRGGARLVLLLGSNVGNLEWEEAASFLRSLRGAMRPGDHALVGFDLAKAPEILQAAYDDPAGVTAAFNLNLLARINRELEGDFDLGAWSHRATYDPARPAMESWLVSLRDQQVRVAGHRFDFASGEAIHTETSWKYREEDVTALAAHAGFSEVARHRDARGWFLDAVWRAGDGG
jgi:L-histidine N-alpha-methyltransferase